MAMEEFMNTIDSINPVLGDYILLADHGVEGIHVVCQAKSFMGIWRQLQAARGEEPRALVKLVQFEIRETITPQADSSTVRE